MDKIKDICEFIWFGIKDMVYDLIGSLIGYIGAIWG
jgi:hypothetical protein